MIYAGETFQTVVIQAENRKPPDANLHQLLLIWQRCYCKSLLGWRGTRQGGLSDTVWNTRGTVFPSAFPLAGIDCTFLPSLLCTLSLFTRSQSHNVGRRPISALKKNLCRHWNVYVMYSLIIYVLKKKTLKSNKKNLLSYSLTYTVCIINCKGICCGKLTHK